ncbi:MAG: adenylate/guanylate cyclase domain-containing protein [Geminicoccales bacterium]
MADDAPTRKLAAILHADVVGYSRLMGEDETGTHRIVRQYLNAITAIIHDHQGRVVSYAGDAVLADFATVTEALGAAVSIQDDLSDRNQGSAIAEERKVQFRIGVHLGEVIVDGDEIHGDGVNIAARLESLAEPGGICISESVRSAVGTKLPFSYAFMGEREVKNISEPVRAYRVVTARETGQSPPPCPYPGMVPFGAADAPYFYGRAEEVARMVQLLRRQRFMMVIGPSGSGKSSLVYAGLLPELEKSRYFAENYWLIRTMRPGPHPTEVLADILGNGDKTRDFEPGTVDALLKAHPPAERLLLLVDQFEELFTQADREEQARFIAALQAFRVPENCALILTLRADFYPDLMTSYLWPVDASQRVEVAPLRGEALREAIEKPAVDVGVRIEDSLVTRLLADAADEPGALPLLQETMGLLWDDMEQQTLPLSAYERLSRDAGHVDGRLSGLAVAIAMKADATLAELNESQQAIARRIFLRLIQFGEGRADTRRQQPVASLRATNDAAGEFKQTLEHLTANRLLTRSGGDDKHPPAVDISHESLIGGWSRLQDWADERRDAEQIRRRLEGKAAEWVRLGKGNGGLLSDVELPEAEHWLASADAADLGFDATLPELVEASQQAVEEVERAREEAREKELRQAETLADEQRQRLEEQTVAAGRMRRSMAGLAAVFIVAVAAAVFAWYQGQKAESLAEQEAVAREAAENRRVEAEQARTQSEARRVEAENARLESVAQLLLIQAPQQQAALLDERGALMARQADRFSATGSRPLKAQVDSVLRTVTGKPYFSTILRPVYTAAVVFSSDGTKLASAHSSPHEVVLWDLAKPGAEPIVLPGFPSHTMLPGTSTVAGYVNALAFSPDGKKLIAAHADGSIAQWHLDNPEMPFVELPTQKSGVWSATYSADGRWLAMGSKLDDSFVVWDLTHADAGPVLVNDPQSAVAGSGSHIGIAGGVPVAFSPDSSMLATGSLNGIVRLWRPDDLTTPLASLRGHEGSMLALAFDADGTRLASSGQDATIRLWNPDEPSAAPVVLESGSTPADSINFNADGNTLASTSGNNIWLWQVDVPGVPPVVMSTPIGRINQVAFSPDGKRLASAGDAVGHLRLWDLEPSGRPLVLTGHQENVASVTISPDGKLFASGGGVADKTIRLWQWDDLSAPSVVWRGHEGEASSLDFSADGSRLLSASWQDNSVRLWNLGQSTPTFTALPTPKSVKPSAAYYSPDGETVAATGHGGVFAWDIAEPDAPAKVLLPSDFYMTELAFSPSSKLLAVSGLGPAIYLKDLTRPDNPAFELLGHGGEHGTWSVAFSPNGERLASGGASDSTVRLWDPGAPDAPSIVLGRHDAEVTRVRFSPDGKQLASISQDRSVRLWNTEDPDSLPIVLSGHKGDVWGLAYRQDGRYLVTGAESIMIWDLTHPLNSSTTEEIAGKVCQKVWRNLTLDEWHKFVGTEIPYERTCPNLPVHPSLFEAAEKLARENDIVGAVALLERAVELDPALDLKPQEEAERLAKSAEQ